MQLVRLRSLLLESRTHLQNRRYSPAEISLGMAIRMVEAKMKDMCRYSVKCRKKRGVKVKPTSKGVGDARS